MRILPNLITFVRLATALVLTVQCLFLHTQPPFLQLFVIAGFSDLLDGYLARRLNCCTEFGARLDSISDAALYSSVLLFLAKYAASSLQSCSGILVLGTFSQIGHIVFSWWKFKTYPAYHTTGSRAYAYVLFGGILVFWLTRWRWVLATLAIGWIACSCEGVAITAILTQPTTNVPNILSALRRKRPSEETSAVIAPELS